MAPLQEDNGKYFRFPDFQEINVEPVIVGLCGSAATGKTSVADALVPQSLMVETEEEIWDQKVLAAPLYSLVSVRRDITGEDALDRQLYETHNVLFDLFGRSPLYGLPPYDVLVDFVYDVVGVPIINEGKPRTFMQQVGDMCREIDPECFVNYMRRLIIRDAAWAVEQDKKYICIVSDIRRENEAELIKSFKGGVVIKYTASKEVRDERLLNRDGFLMTEEQSNHASEQVDNIPEDLIDYIVDTDNLSVKEQAIKTRELALGLVGV